MTLDQIIDILFEAGMSEDGVAHSVRVWASAVDSDLNGHQCATAGLHDVVEDCGVSYQWLREQGVTLVVAAWVMELSRQRSETYAEYIARLSSSTRPIKRLDIEDNLTRGPIPGDLEGRYRKALTTLKG